MMKESIKKRLCDPPHQQIAANGDPAILGMFEGVDSLLDDPRSDEINQDLLRGFLAAVVSIEEEYVNRRTECARATAEEFYHLQEKFLGQLP